MKKLIILCFFLVTGLGVYAEETFESQVYTKEVQQAYGSGTLSVASEAYGILVHNKDVYMMIDIPKKAFDLLKVGDTVKVTFERGLFENEIKAIALVNGGKR